ncbi:MAG: FAD-dependent oxidoreductase [Acidobacteriales bacterium]|nr:FAD-dependent oxidoreductase [Terriglobales bacterium]
MPHQEFTARLLQGKWLSEQTRHLEFSVPELSHFAFRPGQFVSLVAPNKEGRPITRAYSIASAPRENSQFDLCLNRVEQGFFSNLLCDLPEGAELKFHGPHGLFVLRNPLRDSVFIATGTGIAPMRGFLEWIFAEASRHQGRQFWLVYGTRHETSIYYRDEFAELAKCFPNFHYIITLSRGGEGWKGERGYVQEHVRKLLQSLPAEAQANMDAYVCGLNAMVSSARKLLREEFGWNKRQILFERYD